MPRIDTIRKEYFDSVEAADSASDWLFYGGALLSFVALFVERGKYPETYDAVLIAYVICTLAIFAIGLVSRLYLIPRGEDRRRQDFFSNAFGVNLVHQKTDGYYNNDLFDPTKRIAAQILENSHFSKAIALRMTKIERIKIVVYTVLWLVCMLYRRNDLGVVLAATQAVFSEQILAKWFRLEWLRMRYERTFDDVYKLFQSEAPAEQFNALALTSFSMYETAKASAAVTLSSKVFDKLNPSLSKEWKKIKLALKL